MSIAFARIRSSGLVIFIFFSDPSTTFTGILMRSSNAASSVAIKSLCFIPSANAFFNSETFAAWGVCACQTPDLSMVCSITLSLETAFKVSLTGTATIAAPFFSASFRQFSITDTGTKGLTPSCTNTSSTSRGKTSSPAKTESCRCLPPAITLNTFERLYFCTCSSTQVQFSRGTTTMMSPIGSTC